MITKATRALARASFLVGRIFSVTRISKSSHCGVSGPGPRHCG